MERAIAYGQTLDNYSILEIAINAGQAEIVAFMLSESADLKSMIHDVNQTGCTMLYNAAIRGSSEVVKVLLRLGASCSRLCDEDLVRQYARAFGDHTSDIDGEHYRGVRTLSAICGAADMGQYETVRVLLDYGAADVYDYSVGWPPICLAAGTGCEPTVDVLLEYGARLDETTHGGATPLYLAVAEREIAVVKHILHRSTLEIDILVNSRQTPIHKAKESRYHKIIELLADFGANTNTLASDGLSSHHYILYIL